MPIENSLMRRLGLAHPVIQAPMAGNGDTPELVAAVSAAGGLGSIGAAYLSPAQIGEAARAVRARTNRPFAINLFAPVPAAAPPKDLSGAVSRLAPYHRELGLPEPAPPALPPPEGFAAQFEAVLANGPAVFSFTFGMPPVDLLAAAKLARMFIIGTATTVEEALHLQRAGVDAVVAQGSEAGGHRGTFAAPFESGMVGLMALIPQMADAVSLPVVASGGIMDGRGIAAALTLGASAAQMGTAFLAANEAGIAESYRQALLAAHEDATRVTRAFSGRPARGIVNRFMSETEAAGADAILPFPLQNALTRPMRTAASKQGRAEFLSLWAGQGTRLARRLPAGDLVATLAQETAAAIDRLQG